MQNDRDDNATDISADAAAFAPLSLRPSSPMRDALDQQLQHDAHNVAQIVAEVREHDNPSQRVKGKHWKKTTRAERGTTLSVEDPEVRAPRNATSGLTMTQAAFVMAFRIMPNAPMAARAAGVSVSTVDDWRTRDPRFQQAYAEAYDAARGALFASMWISAVEGAVEGVYQGGMCVGFKRKFSDRMREVLAKAVMPEMFARKELQGGGVTVNIKATPEQIAETVRKWSPTRQRAAIEAETVVERQPSGNCGHPPV